ncbi:serine hydrolase [Streptomyces sp. NPDC056468]|uniref:serine hydrolase n=1 Tax=Streptomyces sp. NPDC056468 TaxID=3345830 RepID=UPI0036AA9033
MVSVNRTASPCTAETATAVVVQAGAANPHAYARVVREAGRGRADLTTGRAITSRAVLDTATNSKRLTADVVLLPAGRHQLALNYPPSEYLDIDNPPAWARVVTPGDPMRHTSGIPDCQDLLEDKGIELTDPAGQEEAITATPASQPQDPPGEGFSNITCKVSPDRNTAVTAAYNAEPPDDFRAASQLLDIWTK